MPSTLGEVARADLVRTVSLENMAGLGLLPGVSAIHKFGATPDLDNSEEDIWDETGTYTFLAAAATLYASSSNAGDTTQVIEVQGLDANWAAQTKQVTLTGQTQAALAGTWIRVFRAFNTSGTALAGDVYIATDATGAITAGRPDDATKIKARIKVGNEQTLMAIYSVAADKTALITRWAFSIDSAFTGDATLFVRQFGGVFRVQDKREGVANTIDITVPYGISAPAKSDIKITGVASNVNSTASATFDLLLYTT